MGVEHCHLGVGPLVGTVSAQLHCPCGYAQSSPWGMQSWNCGTAPYEAGQVLAAHWPEVGVLQPPASQL